VRISANLFQASVPQRRDLKGRQDAYSQTVLVVCTGNIILTRWKQKIRETSIDA